MKLEIYEKMMFYTLAIHLPRVSPFHIYRAPLSIRRPPLSSMSLCSSSSTYPSSTCATILQSPQNASSLDYKRDMQKVIQTAEEAARNAGQIMLATSGKIGISKTKMNAADLVTESDVECQRVIQETILDVFPHDMFLGEEDVDAGSEASSSALRRAIGDGGNKERESDGDGDGDGDSDDPEEEMEKFLWIVDPIDGTTNFQAGLPMYAVSIAMVDIGSVSGPAVVAGVIYNPVLNEMVCAVRHQGCYLNGQRMEPRSNTAIDLNQALINVGFPVSSESTLRASSGAVAALATKVRGLRMIASASQVMSWVAQGKLSAYVSWDLNAWDVAAGMVIVEESGGFVSNFDGARADISSRDLVVTTAGGGSSLSEDILGILKENDCLKY